jgi:hypothetical protein
MSTVHTQQAGVLQTDGGITNQKVFWAQLHIFVKKANVYYPNQQNRSHTKMSSKMRFWLETLDL